MNRIYILFIVAAAFLLQACGGVKRVEKKPQLTTTPQKLELFVDQTTEAYTIPVSFMLNVSKNYVPSCARLIYSPRLVAQGHEYKLVPVVITGKNFNRLDQRLQELDGKQPDYQNALQFMTDGREMQVQVSEKIPFELWMPQAKLEVDIVLEACDRDNLLYTNQLADGVVYMPQGPGPVLVKYVRKEVEKKAEGFARFFYPINGYMVDPALNQNRQQLDDMTNLIRKIMTDTLMNVNKIVVTGICSPDGSWIYNQNLAKKRADFIQQYLVNHDKIDPDLIEVRSIAEDWEGLSKLLEESIFSEKNTALNIIGRVSDPDPREAELRKLPQFDYIKQNFYPQLRKVTYEIYYTTKEITEEVIPE